MSVICPNCGTTVDDESSAVCPACHHRLDLGLQANLPDDVGWCESCGSPLPPGAKACPECGMPVEGAFDENRTRFSVRPKEDDGSRATTLQSAVPPAPNKGEAQITEDERRRRTRLLAMAAIAALVLVGGMTLYIGRPWDPDAYRTHAVVDADTSMEGFPGEKPYLSSQDRIEEQAFQDGVTKTEDTIVFAHERMGTLADEAQKAHEALLAYAESGRGPEDFDTQASVTSIKSGMDEITSRFDELDTFVDDQKQRYDEERVLAEYLGGAVDAIVRAWEATKGYDVSAATMPNVTAALNGGMGQRSYDEWMSLFTNAYKG